MSRLLRVSLALCAVFFVSILSACGSDVPGDSVAKVGKKIFVFFGSLDRLEPDWSMSVKLPISSAEALATTNSAPTGYGLGRAGWVTITLVSSPKPDVDLLKDWIEESYRAVAPKKLSKLLDGPILRP